MKVDWSLIVIEILESQAPGLTCVQACVCVVCVHMSMCVKNGSGRGLHRSDHVQWLDEGETSLLAAIALLDLNEGSQLQKERKEKGEEQS